MGEAVIPALLLALALGLGGVRYLASSPRVLLEREGVPLLDGRAEDSRVRLRSLGGEAMIFLLLTLASLLPSPAGAVVPSTTDFESWCRMRHEEKVQGHWTPIQYDRYKYYCDDLRRQRDEEKPLPMMRPAFFSVTMVIESNIGRMSGTNYGDCHNPCPRRRCGECGTPIAYGFNVNVGCPTVRYVCPRHHLWWVDAVEVGK